MKRVNLWSGIFFLSLSIFVCVESLEIGVGSVAVPGPGFLAFWTGFALGCFSLILIIGDIRKRLYAGTTSEGEKVRWKSWAITLAGLLGYALFLETLGFIVCTFILMIALVAFVEPQRWTMVLLVATLTTAASYILFKVILEAQLPAGILGF